MYKILKRYATYKRATIYFTLYSIVLFFVHGVSFLSFKTPIYFLVGFAASGAVAVLFMNAQYKIETKLSPNFWIINVFIEIVGYYLYVQLLFYLFYLI